MAPTQALEWASLQDCPGELLKWACSPLALSCLSPFCVEVRRLFANGSKWCVLGRNGRKERPVFVTLKHYGELV